MNVTYSPNELVVFVKKNKPVLGSICSVNNNSLTVLSEEGKEIDVSSDQIELKTSIIINSNANSSEKKLMLRGYRRELNKISEEVDLEFLWECVVGSAEKISFNDLLELYYGDSSFSNDEVLKIYWAINRDTIYFKKVNNSYFPVSKLEVNSKLRELEEEERKKEEMSVAVEYFRNLINNKKNVEPTKTFDKDYFINLIKNYVIATGSSKRSREAKSFVHQLGINRIEDATEFLIRIGEWNSNADPDLKRLEETENFSKKSLNETEKILSSVFEKDSFVDLTSKEIIAIDDEDTEDIDDAISIDIKSDSIELGVHICNVAYYIRKGSSLDIEARNKGETVYIPDKHIDIFPKELIIEKFSLFAGQPKLAISLLIQLDKKTYKIKEYKFIKSIVSVSRNFSYIEAENELLKEKKGKELVNIAIALRKKRIMKGAFILQLPELKLKINEDGSINIYRNYMKSIPHMIIAELMILTNSLAAKFIKEHNIPSIFRVQSEEIPQEGRELDSNDPLYSIKVVKHLRPSIISTDSESHKPLGLNSYVQVTSPIRRYFDLVVQRQIIGILEGNEWIYDDKELSEIISTVTNGFGERRLKQKNRRKYWLYRYLQDNLDENIKGIISSANETYSSAYLPDFFLEVPIKNHSTKNLKEYDEVTLNVEEVDPLRKNLSLKLMTVG